MAIIKNTEQSFFSAEGKLLNPNNVVAQIIEKLRELYAIQAPKPLFLILICA